MFQKRIIVLTLFAALAVMPEGVLRAQWVPTNGIYGGNIQSLVVNGETLFASIGGSVFRSTNGGVSWSEANRGIATGEDLTNLGTNGVHVFANYESDVYEWSDDSLSWVMKGILPSSNIYSFGAKDTNLFAATNQGINRSTDEGATWTIAGKGVPQIYYSCVPSFAVIDTFIFVAIENVGFFRSSDNGNTWTHADSGIGILEINCNLLVNGKNLFAPVGNRVFVSTNFGTSWDSLNSGVPDVGVNVLALLGQSLVAGTSEGVYISTNNGVSWQAAGNGMPNIGINSLVVSGDTLLAGTGYYGVFRSLDTGRTWTQASIGLVSMAHSAFAVMGNTFFSGLWRSDDLGANWKWVESNDVPSYDYVYDEFSAMVSLGTYLIAGDFGIFRSSDSGISWDTMYLPCPTDYIESFTVIGSKVFACTQDFGAFASSDSGSTWVAADSGLPPKSRVESFCGVGNYIVAGLGVGLESTSCVFFSSDEGQTWTPRNSGFDQYDEGCNFVGSIDTTVFAQEDNRFYRSNINDTSWTSLGIGAVTSFTTIDTTIFAGTQGGLFVSYDDGDNWFEVDSGITYPSILSLAVCDSMLIAGTSWYGSNHPSVPTVWRRSLSQMTSSPYAIWANADAINFGTIPVGSTSLRIDTLSNNGKSALTIRSFQMTQSQKVFQTSDLSSSVELNPGETFTFEVFFNPIKPGVYTANMVIMSEAKRVNLTLIGTAYGNDGIEQESQPATMLNVFPNPFSQSTQISFTSQSAGYADVSVVNLLGAPVARVFSGELGAGQHSFTFSNTASLPDGMYECLIRMNARVEKLPMMKLSEP